jgi:hypothetical protein
VWWKEECDFDTRTVRKNTICAGAYFHSCNRIWQNDAIWAGMELSESWRELWTEGFEQLLCTLTLPFC